MQTQQIFILDPGTPANGDGVSPNLGDEIIQAAVTRELMSTFPASSIVRASTHARLRYSDLKAIGESNWIFVGGSNLLGNMTFRPKSCWWWEQWKIGLRDARCISNAILFGVGWRRYQLAVGWYTRRLCRAALSQSHMHSVRDGYTKTKLESIGMYNVINTGCPTLWPLVGCLESEFPTEKAESVLTMITDYKTERQSDGELLHLLCRKYRRVYLWPQGRGDKQYVERFGLPIIILDRSLGVLDELLNQTHELDYVGTRLHGGIRCLLARRRSLILCFGNRAREMFRDRGLETVDRGDLEAIERWINGPTRTCINIDGAPIEEWRSQFDARHT